MNRKNHLKFLQILAYLQNLDNRQIEVQQSEISFKISV